MLVRGGHEDGKSEEVSHGRAVIDHERAGSEDGGTSFFVSARTADRGGFHDVWDLDWDRGRSE